VILQRLRKNYAAMARRLCNSVAAILQRLQTVDINAIAPQFRSESALTAKRQKAILKRMESRFKVLSQ
jgi:hypothetical protein